MDSWSQTKSLVVIMAVIAAFYVLGRIVAGALEQLSAGGFPPI